MMKRPKSISAGFSIDYVGDASKRYADENVHFSCFHQCSYAAQKTHESVRHTQVKDDLGSVQRIIPLD